MTLRIYFPVCGISERRIEACRSALESIRKLSAIEGKDRLELVKSINTSLVLMDRSLSGWKRWVNNPNTMAIFSQKELKDMEKNLSLFAESFIEYDLKTTRLGLDKKLKRKKKADGVQTQFIM